MDKPISLEHGTLIDATGGPVLSDTTILVADGMIQAVGRTGQVEVPEDAEIIDLSGSYVVPGLMDANVHLVATRTPDTLLEFEGRYHDLAVEAAELTLKYGVTTVFDTWGPAAALTTARDLIAAGERVGSRIYCAGNIIGLGGPLSPDFFDVGSTLETDTVRRINNQWEVGTGPRLMSMTVEEVGEQVEKYIEQTGVDFIKFAGSDHRMSDLKFLIFSEAAQRRIVEVAHAHGKLAQAHTTTVESLRIEIEVGADLLQHGTVTVDQPISDALLDTIVSRRLPVAATVMTERYLKWSAKNMTTIYNDAMNHLDVNNRRLIERGGNVLLTSDGFAYGSRIKEHPGFRAGSLHDEVPDMPTQLGNGHLRWIRAAFERGMQPLEVLRSATINVAKGYGIADILGTIEPGKIADLLILDDDPLTTPNAYAKVRHVIKGGRLVNRSTLAVNLLLADEPAA